MSAILPATTAPISLAHPFTATRRVAELEAYLLTLLPPHKENGGFYALGIRSYVRAIATYYAGHPTGPACSIVSVVATIVHGDLGRVLAMLSSYPESQRLVQYLITAHQQGVGRQLESLLSLLQMNLAYLNVEGVLGEVETFLLRFPALTTSLTER